MPSRIAAVNYLEKTVTAVVADGTLTLEDTMLGFDRGALAGLYDQYRALEQEGYSRRLGSCFRMPRRRQDSARQGEGAADSELLSAYESLRRGASGRGRAGQERPAGSIRDLPERGGSGGTPPRAGRRSRRT